MENNREIINFSKHITPLPTEIKQGKGNDKIVLYGNDNLYPNFLLKLYNNSPLHKGIINSKVDYVIGDGVFNKATGEAFNPMVNGVDTLEELIQKITFDAVIFGYFSIEVVYNQLGKPIEFIHVPSHSVRINRSFTMFQYCDDWFQNSRNVLSFDRWIKGANDDGKSKLFVHTEYTPSVNNIYATPEYSGAIVSLETDLAIRDFHLNNITNGFSVASLITYYGQNLPPEQKREFTKKLEKAYSGTNGAKFIVEWVANDGKGSEIKNIGANDWHLAYQVLKESVQQDILTAHSASSPLLFGLQQEGKLGGSTELKDAYHNFKNLYVKNKRNKIESGLNKLFADAGYPTIEFKDKSIFVNGSISDTTKEKVYTINELRKIDGLTPLADGDKLLADTKEPVKFSFSKEVEEPKNEYHSLTDEDFEKVKHLGLSKADFEIIEKSEAIESFSQLNQIINQFDDDDAISNYLLKADLNGKTVADIRIEIKKELGIDITVSDLGTKITKLNNTNVLASKIEKGVVVNSPIQKVIKPSDAKNAVEVLYSYEGPKDDRNRPFCSKILENDRLFTREEIQSISTILNYDVWRFKGGWYFNPKTQENTPYCRHTWHANKVIRKEQGK
jgi:hypothetical protein